MAQIDWENQIAEIRRDRTAGASELIWRVTDMLIEAISRHNAGGVNSTRRWLLEISRDVIAAKPAVGPLFSLVNRMLWAAESAMNAGDIRQAAAAYVADFQANWEMHNVALTQQAVHALARFSRLLVYGSDATVLRALLALGELESPPEILCGEGRPGYEGLVLASELVPTGIKVTIGIDMALPGWLARADALLLDCESLSRGGVISRLGATVLMRIAHEREMPVIVLCQQARLLPADYIIDVSSVTGEPEQIMQPQGENLIVSNVLLDQAPLEMVSTVVTEDGALVGEALAEVLAGMRIYPGLRGA